MDRIIICTPSCVNLALYTGNNWAARNYSMFFFSPALYVNQIATELRAGGKRALHVGRIVVSVGE